MFFGRLNSKVAENRRVISNPAQFDSLMIFIDLLDVLSSNLKRVVHFAEINNNISLITRLF